MHGSCFCRYRISGTARLVRKQFVYTRCGGSVFIYYTGSEKSAYDLLLEKGDFAPEKRTEKKGEKLIQAIAAAYWPIVTACYLVWSFVTGKWGFTWIIWVVAGLIFGAISAVISIIFREN